LQRWVVCLSGDIENQRKKSLLVAGRWIGERFRGEKGQKWGKSEVNPMQMALMKLLMEVFQRANRISHTPRKNGGFL
jgi:hypothetical protein